jgi:hypothetical protein
MQGKSTRTNQTRKETRKMKKARIKMLARMALLMAVVLATGVVRAQATKTPVEGLSLVEYVAADKIWVDEQGVMHFRGTLLLIEAQGALTGTGTVVGNMNMDYATGNGDGCFLITYNVSWEAPWGETLTGTFEGHGSTTYTGWFEEGHGVLHGSGDFAGMKFIQNWTGWWDAPPKPWQGIILDPHGE